MKGLAVAGGLVAVFVTAAAPSATRPERGTPPVERLGWLTGCWEGEYPGGRAYEEVWLPPRGGTLLGVSRTLREEATVAWEYLRIASEDGDLVYHAQPSGQAPTRFTASEVTAERVVFANPEHDFPQRIIYRTAPPDSLIARIEGERNGQVRGIDFPMRRVPCPA